MLLVVIVWTYKKRKKPQKNALFGYIYIYISIYTYTYFECRYMWCQHRNSLLLSIRRMTKTIWTAICQQSTFFELYSRAFMRNEPSSYEESHFKSPNIYVDWLSFQGRQQQSYSHNEQRWKPSIIVGTPRQHKYTDEG